MCVGNKFSLEFVKLNFKFAAKFSMSFYRKFIHESWIIVIRELMKEID